MALRELVTGGGPCAPSDGASSSNPLAGLADNLLGGSSKAQEQLHELPGMHPPQMGHPGAGTSASAMAAAFAQEQAGPIPGLPSAKQGKAMGDADAEAFLAGLQGGPRGRPQMGMPGMPRGEMDAFEAAFREGQGARAPFATAHAPPGAAAALAAGTPPYMTPGLPQERALTSTIQSFLDAARSQAEVAPPMIPDLGLTARDKQRIRDRSAIMARHLWADQGEAFADAQVGRLMSSLRIQMETVDAEVAAERGGGLHHPMHHGLRHHPGAPHAAAADMAAAARDAGLAGAMAGMGRPGEGWASEFGAPGGAGMQAAARPAPPGARGWGEEFGAAGARGVAAGPPSTGWAEDFAATRGGPPVAATGPGGWAEDFAAARGGPGGWAEEFGGGQRGGGEGEWGDQFADDSSAAAARRAAAGTSSGAAGTSSHTAALVETLSSDPDPKFQNSQFLKFVSKMSRGEIVLEGNEAKEVAPPGPANRAVGGGWADEFSAQAEAEGASRWAEQFDAGPGMSAMAGAPDWAKEFTMGGGDGDWGGEFARGVARGFANDLEESSQWANQFVQGEGGIWAEAFNTEQEAARSGAPDYMWAEENPYRDHANPLEEGRRLFREGVLSEAVLAFEAALARDPGSCEGWRLLGMVHAENDDDRQAIAAMMRARNADPTNLEVLLSLGVSHTNELDREEALSHMRAWLSNNPQYAQLENEFPLEVGQAEDVAMAQGRVVRMYQAASELNPADADVWTVLGVLHNLTRQFDAAEEAFKRALELRPRDYSLWNKLGATQANSSKSEDAVAAYRRALDVKPNYVRAWSNMGISYANQGRYEESVSYYVRALTMNPRASNVWSYLRIAVGLCGRVDMVRHVDGRDLDALAEAFPL